MKASLKTLALTALLATPAYAGPSQQDVWTQLTSDPYQTLPTAGVSIGSFFDFAHNRLKQAANRTLSDHSDLLPPFQKLVHPYGVCLAGTWTIDTESPYTGAFAKGSEYPIIVRASTGNADTTAGKRRVFGFAGKLFPADGETANFFAVDDLGGTRARHYLDVTPSNEPKLSPPPLSELPAGFAVLKTFAAVDRNSTIRQVYELSELGLADLSAAQTPHWLRISAAPGQTTADKADFRDELQTELAQNGGKLVFIVSVSGPEDGTPVWHDVGRIELTEAVASASCDQRLHFHHPRWVDGLQEPNF